MRDHRDERYDDIPCDGRTMSTGRDFIQRAQFKASNTEQKTTFGKLFHRRPPHTALLIIKGVV